MLPLPQYQNKAVGVFGLGKSGLATAQALIESGAAVLAWDDSDINRAKIPTDLEQKMTLLPTERWNWKDLECLILAPGVPLTHPEPHHVVKEALANGCVIKGDIELLYENYPDVPIVAITGTNGKSSTTTLIGHILKQAGMNAQVGGNLGTAALALEPLKKDEGVYVVELSSYQLDLLIMAKFHVALLLNITPDHLDRHGGMEGYVLAKRRIFSGQTAEDTAIIGIDTPPTQSIYKQAKDGRLWPNHFAQGLPKTVPVSVGRDIGGAGVYVLEGVLYDKRDPDNPAQIDISDVYSLQGAHNWQNAAAAYTACRSLGVSPKDIASGLRSFPGLKHRMELITTVENIRFVNDSKATNAEATLNALAAYQHIYWIAGGKPKGDDLSILLPFLPKVKRAYFMGEAQDEFMQFFAPHTKATACDTLDVALLHAAADAQKEHLEGAVVLLSPACASFDQFDNFEHRGEVFSQLALDYQTSNAARRTV